MTEIRQSVVGSALVIGVAFLASIALMIAFGVSVIGQAAPGVSLALLAGVADVPAVLLVGWVKFRPENGIPPDMGAAEDEFMPPQEVIPAFTPEGRGSEVLPW